VEAVGQLDEQDPDVVGHGHEHLAHGRRLLGLPVLESEAVELGDAVHHPGHFRPELADDVVDGQAGVLHRVVQ
jgi:hypothetical protein